MDHLPASVFADRLRMATAEIGWEWPVWGDDATDTIYLAGALDLPRAVVWAAFEVVDPASQGCWPCYSASMAMEHGCREGRCHHPNQPRRPPAELLVKRHR